MWTQQLFAAFFCTILALQQIEAVVNKQKVEADTNKQNSDTSSSVVADSATSGTEQEANRREAPLSLTDSYGAPLPGGLDSYVPSAPSNPGLPLPVYGAPDNGIQYPEAPADVPPLPTGPSGLGGGHQLSLSDTYGPPQPIAQIPHDTYGPPKQLFVPQNNYGPPKNTYGPPKDSYSGIKDLFVPSLDNGFGHGGHGDNSFGHGGHSGNGGHGGHSGSGGHGGHSGNGGHGSHGPPPQKYGPPPPKYGPPRFNKPPPLLHKPKQSYGPPRPHYGPPKPIFVPKHPKPVYGPPKQHFNHKPVYGPPKLSYGPPHGQIGGHIKAPTNVYGPPVSFHHDHQGPPDPIPHGPPHPGIPAPPTPPDIKYDGWQPIPGLVSHPPADTYGVPHGQQHSAGDLQFNTDFQPPPVGEGIGHLHVDVTSDSFSGGSQGLSDSYGAPLNTVTGSGGVVISSGDQVGSGHAAAAQHAEDHHHHQHHGGHSDGGHQSDISVGLTAAGISTGQNDLSVIKSIGYEIFHNQGQGQGHHGGHVPSDSYGAPPSNSFSPNGPYAAAHSYKTNSVPPSFSFGNNFGGSGGGHGHGHGHSFNGPKQHGLSLSSAGIGLIPPSGVYGVPPSGSYGTSLISTSHSNSHGHFNSHHHGPKRPIFREPHKEHHGGHQGHGLPSGPSNLFSLPSIDPPVSFHNLKLEHNVGSGLHAGALTSYTAPLNTVDGSYGVPSHPGTSVGIDSSHPPLTIDLTHLGQSNFGHSGFGGQSFGSGHNFGGGQQGFGHGFGGHGYDSAHSGSIGVPVFHKPFDCSAHKSQPLPSLSYGVPSANGYTAALSSLTTNIQGGSHNSLNLDSHGSHSHTISQSVSLNGLEGHGEKSYGKSLGESFAPGGEVIKSESIDLNNIPLQGTQGSYTLQIQSSDGTAPQALAQTGQVLNEGLLQSILSAIEQPQQNNNAGQSQLQYLNQQAAQQNYEINYQSSVSTPQDAEAQLSVQSEVSVPASETPATESTPKLNNDASMPMIDNNEVALYFNQNKANKDDEVRNGQQYGNFMSFKSANSEFEYGDPASVNLPPVTK